MKLLVVNVFILVDPIPKGEVELVTEFNAKLVYGLNIHYDPTLDQTPSNWILV